MSFRLEAIPIEKLLLWAIFREIIINDRKFNGIWWLWWNISIICIKSSIFMQVISDIIIDFNNKITSVKKDNGDHHHHEIMMMIIIHKSLLLWISFIYMVRFYWSYKIFESVNKYNRYVNDWNSISVAIPYDYLYLTQVIIIISTYVHYFHVIIFNVNFFISCLS